MLELVKLGRIDKADEEGLPLLSLTVVDEFIHELPPPSPTMDEEIFQLDEPGQVHPQGEVGPADRFA